MLIEPALDGLQNMLVLPTLDPALLAGGAELLDRACLASRAPIAMQGLTLFLAREAPNQPLASGAKINILFRYVAKILFPETAVSLAA
jgi:hypothetical protein